MVKAKVVIDKFTGELVKGEVLNCVKGETVELSDATWEIIKKTYSKWFTFLEKVDERKSYVPTVNKMFDKHRIKNK